MSAGAGVGSDSRTHFGSHEPHGASLFMMSSKASMISGSNSESTRSGQTAYSSSTAYRLTSYSSTSS